MKLAVTATLRRFIREEHGQVLPIMAFMMIALLAMVGYALDLGRALYTYRQLQASCDAAALAGAESLPGSGATSVAAQFGSTSGSLNARSSLAGVSMVSGYPKVVCLNTLKAQGMACVAPTYGNAVVVKQVLTLPLYFMRLVGISTLNVGASATASMRGSAPSPYNVAIIVDTTGSMNNYDSDSNCANTRISCALSGVQVLLQNLSPCGASQTNCGAATNGNVANAVDRVSLYTFPGLASAAQAQYDYNCGNQTPSISPYNDPIRPQYQVINFSSDYRTSSSATSLNTLSNLAKSSGGLTNCPGLKAVGGYGTYYAGIIYAAQADLAAQSSANPGTKNVLILLSDGDANANSHGMPNASPSTGVYPSLKNQCQQAVVAAAAATAAGTQVYSVAYGATSSGCSTDSPSISPCSAMEQIASSPQNFFSDYSAQGGASTCVSSAQPTTGLSSIFTQIAGSLTVSRLIPDNTP